MAADISLPRARQLADYGGLIRAGTPRGKRRLLAHDLHLLAPLQALFSWGERKETGLQAQANPQNLCRLFLEAEAVVSVFSWPWTTAYIGTWERER